MNPATSTIDRGLRPPRGLAAIWAAPAAAAVLLAGIYDLGLNGNLLYLSLLLAASAVLSAFLRRLWAVALGIGACVYLAVAPAHVDDLGTPYPAPRDIPGASNMWVTPIPDGATWAYRFTLGEPAGRSEGGACAGHLYIDGRGLSGLVVGVQGRTFEGSACCSRKNGLDHLDIPLEGGPEPALDVSVWGAPGARPKIFHGPEANGFQLYGDAVWLEFDGNGVRAVYHAVRSAPGAVRPCPCGERY